jgi:hypothetical protein
MNEPTSLEDLKYGDLVWTARLSIEHKAWGDGYDVGAELLQWTFVTWTESPERILLVRLCDLTLVNPNQVQAAQYAVSFQPKEVFLYQCDAYDHLMELARKVVSDINTQTILPTLTLDQSTPDYARKSPPAEVAMSREEVLNQKLLAANIQINTLQEQAKNERRVFHGGPPSGGQQ